MADFIVAGRQFRTQSDYKAALRDQAQIEAIKNKINMEQPGEVIRLSADLKAGKYQLVTLVGRDFKDEVQELAEKYKKQGYTKDSRVKLSKQKKKAVGARKKSSKDTPKKVSLEDYDAKMQKEIKEVLKKREKRRKLIVALCSIIALGCFGYYGVYYYYAEKTQADYNNLSELKGSTTLASTSGTQGVTIHYTEEEEEIELTVLEQYETLYNKNKRLIGWLKIEDTN
ncbi:MAG: SrtB family sortase, partial [Lachnospiraceae bacterium]|nr:SrtB family sortase [Lachnospiraceae bacterium]